MGAAAGSRAAQRNAESTLVISVIKPIVPTSSTAIAPLFLGVAVLTLKEAKLSRSRLIVGHNIGEVFEAAMRTVRRIDAEDARFHQVCASLRQTSSKNRGSECTAVI